MPNEDKLPRGFQLPDNAPADLVIEDDDFLEHPDIFVADELILDLETELLTPLFPDGSADVLAGQWRELFEGDASLRLLAPRTAEAYRSAGDYSGTGRDTGIANRLRAYGLKVVEVAGWQTRGSETFHPRGSVDHHTAAGNYSNAPSLNICIYGRSDLPGPLCQVLIGRDNTCYVIAAGRANHAGTGSWNGVVGNSNMYGVEHENTGTGSEPWREDQRATAAKVHAALLDWRRDSGMVCEHKEWTTRKIDKWGQTGSDMRNRINAAWIAQANGEVTMPLFPTHTSRENFVKQTYRDVAGREVESATALNQWVYFIASNEAAAFTLVSNLAKESRVAQDQKISSLQNRTVSAEQKLQSVAEAVESYTPGDGVSADAVIDEIVGRLTNG